MIYNPLSLPVMIMVLSIYVLQRERRKYDKNTGKQVKKKYVRSELILILKETGIINPVGSVK
jgi:hypothetical protein